MRQSSPDDVWSVLIYSASGAQTVALYRVARATAEAAVIGALFDTDQGIGMGGTSDREGYPRVCVWNER